MPERAQYFEVPGAHLHTVLHCGDAPVARLLLVGPFASERYFAYHTCVRWARYLADRRVDVLRFDYRGVGESTGSFEEVTFADWEADLQLLIDWLRHQPAGVPLVLHGFELGAILAARTFSEGTGDALLQWTPPASANQVLRSTLLRWSGLEQMYDSPENRTTGAEYIRRLESGAAIEVQGYLWSSRLWQDSFLLKSPMATSSESLSDEAGMRPVKSMRFGRNANTLTMPYLRFDEVNDLTPLFAESFAWMAEALGLPQAEAR